MNPDQLAQALSDNAKFTLQQDSSEYDKEHETRKASFEIVSEAGEVIGYVKTWQDDDSFAGFVRFDSDGRVQDWKVFDKRLPH
ncbi:hypothetical protein [Marinobacter similis]|uniref:Uncharacterized protein n=1 Tax=Marinobacter similis TaxID=1420916 RepID=W5YGY4_9GAMM|nr:hypothetical protein [Marinobacter similis]AHI28149.1 hypothetical protein AU14_04520 [Marinobacter similis]